MRARLAAAFRAILGLAGLAILLAALHAAGDVLPTPPLHAGGLPDWVRARDPVTGVIGLLRLVALAGGWYLTAVSALVALAELTRAAGLVRISRLVTTPGVRRAARAVLGASLLTALTVPPALAAEGVRPTARPVAAHESGLQRARDDGETDRAWLAEALAALTEGSPGTAPSRLPSTTDTGAAAVVDGHVVRRGESFWSIAADVTGPDADTAELAAYWRRLVAANRGRLVDPDDADLIHPGQRLVLPRLQPPGAGQR